MKIIITESQYKLLTEVNMTEENLRNFLYSIWNTQKKRGEIPNIDDIIYQVTEIQKNSREDYEVIRPIWYDYNGGYKNLLQQIRDEIEHDEIQIKGDGNLDMIIFVDEVYSYGETEQGGIIDIICRVVGGTLDGYVYNEDTQEMEMVPNMDIFEQYSLLDYDTGDFEQFLADETYSYFYNKLNYIGLPIHIDLMVK
jgi:hypothetical protein